MTEPITMTGQDLAAAKAYHLTADYKQEADELMPSSSTGTLSGIAAAACGPHPQQRGGASRRQAARPHARGGRGYRGGLPLGQAPRSREQG